MNGNSKATPKHMELALRFFVAALFILLFYSCDWQWLTDSIASCVSVMVDKLYGYSCSASSSTINVILAGSDYAYIVSANCSYASVCLLAIAFWPFGKRKTILDDICLLSASIVAIQALNLLRITYGIAENVSGMDLFWSHYIITKIFSHSVVILLVFRTVFDKYATRNISQFLINAKKDDCESFSMSNVCRKKIIITILLILCVCTFSVLRFGNSQWCRAIFMFQAYLSPGKGWLVCPRNYTGIWRDWDEYGRLRVLSTYKNERLSGYRMEFYENGGVVYVDPLKNGKTHGALQIWYDSGEMLKEEQCVNGRSHGRKAIFYKNGKIKELKWFIHDEEVSREKFLEYELKQKRNSPIPEDAKPERGVDAPSEADADKPVVNPAHSKPSHQNRAEPGGRSE